MGLHGTSWNFIPTYTSARYTREFDSQVHLSKAYPIGLSFQFFMILWETALEMSLPLSDKVTTPFAKPSHLDSCLSCVVSIRVYTSILGTYLFSPLWKFTWNPQNAFYKNLESLFDYPKGPTILQMLSRFNTKLEPFFVLHLDDFQCY